MRWLVGISLAALLVTILVTTIGARVVVEDRTAPSSTVQATGPAATLDVVPPGLPKYSVAEVSSHATSEDCWLIVNARVYDVTGYLSNHPGGQRTITPWCGMESTAAFATEDGRGEHSPEAWIDLERYLIGHAAG